jgi:hypothetical protein
MLAGVVYKLKCKDDKIKEFYIGSSCEFNKRVGRHKNDCYNLNSRKYNYKVYRFIREHQGFENWCFEILLEVQVESKEELRLNYEAKFQQDLKPELNVKQEGRTQKEYYEDYKEEIKIKKKKYREDHKEEIAIKNKEYYEDHKEEIKKYREDHKEELSEYQKQYKQDHKEEILIQQKEKFDCECGGKYTKCNILRHFNTKKHVKYLESVK